MRATPSRRADEKFAHVRDSKIVGKSVVFNLHMCEIETAALTLNGSRVTVWYMLSNRAATFRVAKVQPALID